MSTIADNLTALSSYLVGIRNSLVDKGIIFGDEPLSAFSLSIDIATESQMPPSPKSRTAFWIENNRIPQYDIRTENIISRNNEAIPDNTIRIMLGTNILSVGESAFEQYQNLSSFQTNTLTKTIGKTAFLSCENLKRVILEPGLTSISQSAFKGCTSLEKINFPDSLITIQGEAFNGCKNLSGELVIPDDVTIIGAYAFAGCTSLTEIVFKNKYTSTVRDMDNYPFGISADKADNIIKGELGDEPPVPVEEPTT